jgi:hypothetical protein
MAGSFDPQCLELARYFLGVSYSEETAHELADRIQGAIEDFIVARDLENPNLKRGPHDA